jgi:hypothetical protein
MALSPPSGLARSAPRRLLVRTPRALGIARSTLYERVKDDGLTVPARADTNGDLVSPLPA